MSIEVLQLSNYVRPVIKESNSKDYVLNGDKNSFYQYIIDRYNGSPTNRAIIDSYAKFIYGKGLTSKEKNSKAMTFAKVTKILSKKDLKNICRDYALFGEASMELSFKGGILTKIYHVPKYKIAPNKMNDDGDITSYWFSQDFSNERKYPATEIDAFGFNKPKNGSQICVITHYDFGKNYYCDPDYLSGLPYAELEEEIANYCINHIQNGLSFGYVINMNNGEPPSEDVKRQIKKDIEGKLTGSSNAGKFVINFNEKDNPITVEALEVSEAHKQYEFLSQEARQQIFTGHKVISPILFGVKDNTGLGNNANELDEAFKKLMQYTIQPKKEIILDFLMDVFADNNLIIDLDFIPLIEEQQAQTNLSKQNNDLDSIVANFLIDLGEVVSDDYELIDESVQDYEPELTESALNVSLKLARTFSSFPNAKSDEDTTLFKIRYEYAGSLNPQREFCAKMMAAGKVYRKEDIMLAGAKIVNEGFGLNGSNTYDIWAYKGGPNCKHFWQRKIYLRKNNETITIPEAKRLLKSFNNLTGENGKLPETDRVATTKPIDLPNNGYAK